MNFNIFKSLPIKSVGKAALGLTAAGTIALNMLIVPWEQTHLKPYWDKLANVATACSGITGPEITKAYQQGYTFTDAECARMDAVAVAKHEHALRSVISDSVEKNIHDFTMAAFISWTYNVGPAAASKSTLVGLINSGRLSEACEQLPRWVRVKGSVVSGLENRRWRGDAHRISERTLCLIGINPSYKTPLFEKSYFSYLNWINDITKL